MLRDGEGSRAAFNKWWLSINTRLVVKTRLQQGQGPWDVHKKKTPCIKTYPHAGARRGRNRQARIHHVTHAEHGLYLYSRTFIFGSVQYECVFAAVEPHAVPIDIKELSDTVPSA
jgi:hypothetical protein